MPERTQSFYKRTEIVSDDYAARYYEKHFPQVIPDINTEIKDTSKHYKHYSIPKKSDPTKKRPIDAPDNILKNAQYGVKYYIEDYLKALPHNAAHAYVKERSVVTAMEEHQKNNSNWYLQIDLKNFFNSIDEDFMRNQLLQVYPFPLINEAILDYIIKLSLLKGHMPQGSILSPTLSNLIMVPFDYMFVERLKKYKKDIVYTRYADDITISSRDKFNPEIVIYMLKSYLKNTPLRINDEKTRYGNTSGRNYHLGIILNNKGKDKTPQMSVGYEKNKKFRAMLFNFCTYGDNWELHDVQKMLGQISYLKSIEKPFVERTIAKYNEKFNMDIMARAKMMLK